MPPISVKKMTPGQRRSPSGRKITPSDVPSVKRISISFSIIVLLVYAALGKVSGNAWAIATGNPVYHKSLARFNGSKENDHKTKVLALRQSPLSLRLAQANQMIAWGFFWLSGKSPARPIKGPAIHANLHVEIHAPQRLFRNAIHDFNACRAAGKSSLVNCR